MKKAIILIIMFALIINIASALKECKEVMEPREIPCEIITTFQYPEDCSTYEIKIFNQTPGLIQTLNLTNYTGTDRCNTTFNITDKGSYIFNISNDGDSGRIIVETQDKMASLAIMVFILIITGTLFILPFIKRFSKIEVTDLIIKRSCWALAIYLMMLNSSIAATMAENAGLNLTQEMFRYMWLFGIAGHLALLLLVSTTIFNVIKLMKKNAEIKKMRYDPDDGVDDMYV